MNAAMFLRGALIGLAVAAPVGPIGVLCINRTLADGRLIGFASGLGAALADAIYAAIAAFGVTAVAGALVHTQTWLRLVGGLFLLALGLRIFFARPAVAGAQAAPARTAGALGTTFVLTLTNPATILAFAAIFSGLGLAKGGRTYTDASLMVGGVFAGSALWWLALSTAVGMVRDRLDARRVAWVNRASGCLIAAFGVIALMGARA